MKKIVEEGEIFVEKETKRVKRMNIQTDEEERAKKWREVKKLVSDGINTKRSDICTAMKKVFFPISVQIHHLGKVPKQSWYQPNKTRTSP